MRRGPGGGLVVTKPQAQASIDTIALYLQYRKPSREDLRCVRDAIEIDNVAKVVAKVVKRRTESEVAAFLHLDNPSVLARWKPSRSRRRRAQGRCRGVSVPHRTGATGRQRVAGPVLRIIVELFRRHWSSTGQALPSWADVVAVEHAHLRILQAIEAGDDSLARYRIRRHLDAAASWWL